MGRKKKEVNAELIEVPSKFKAFDANGNVLPAVEAPVKEKKARKQRVVKAKAAKKPLNDVAFGIRLNKEVVVALKKKAAEYEQPMTKYLIESLRYVAGLNMSYFDLYQKNRGL